ncbi:MAG: HEAT repeat domain-containing protein [Planctomycetes bacterium]|nr:HEAT repeat domain-containing protein [Planctomycetota bacterium]
MSQRPEEITTTETIKPNDISGKLSQEIIKLDDVVNLFADFVSARTIEKRESLRSEILANASPESILNSALSEYRQKGNEERLVFASSLLGDFGRQALKPLKTLVASSSPECEYFVLLIPYLAGISSSEKIELLTKLAKNEDVDVRFCVVEALREIEPQSDTFPVWKILAEDEDEEIRYQAKDEISID